VSDLALLVGRLLFGALFLYNGINHFRNLAALTGYTQYKRVPAAAASVVVSGLWLIVSSLSLILGIWPHAGAIMIVVFLLVVSPVMHNYWAATDDSVRMNDFIHFSKNLALAGGALLALAIPEPWAYAVVP
jgi:uncharacterized membrane protein YphA (DoxX/SURF4 family)